MEQANAHLELIKEPQGVDLGLSVWARGVFDHIDAIADKTVQSVQEEMALLEQRCYQEESVGNKEVDSKPNTSPVASKLNKALNKGCAHRAQAIHGIYGSPRRLHIPLVLPNLAAYKWHHNHSQ